MRYFSANDRLAESILSKWWIDTKLFGAAPPDLVKATLAFEPGGASDSPSCLEKSGSSDRRYPLLPRCRSLELAFFDEDEDE